MNPVSLTNEIQARSGGKSVANGTNQGSDFNNLFSSVLGKTSGGYKDLDKNNDGQVDVEDLKLIFPDMKERLFQVEQAMGKKTGDANWEDETRLTPGYKHADINRNGVVDSNEFCRLRSYIQGRRYYLNYDVNKDGKLNNEDLNLVQRAIGKRSGQPGWEDEIQVVKEGTKRADFNQDGRVDKEDLFTVLQDAENLSFIREAYEKKAGDPGWQDRTEETEPSSPITVEPELENGIKAIIDPNIDYKNLDLNVDDRIDQKDLQIFFAAKYEDGTLIKNNEQTYIMMAGTKRLIPDEKTFNILGFDHANEIAIPENELELIPDMGELPAIKHDDGTVIKSSDDKLYMMSQGMKIEIPDQTTYEALGLNVSPHNITIRAKGTADDGVFPAIQLRIDGEPIKEWFMTNEYKDYSVTVPLSEGQHKIEIAYPNDQDIETYIDNWQRTEDKWYGKKIIYYTQAKHNVIANRELMVDQIRIDNDLIQAEDTARVRYDKGSSNDFESFSDEKDVAPGQELMKDAGALRFNYSFTTAINVSEQEFKNIPEAGSLPEIKYANGTILKDDKGKLWLAVMGQRRLIPDETTLEALGLDKKKIESISSSELHSELQKIPEAEAIPAIKYKNGTILEAPDGRHYLMSVGVRREITSEDILKDLAVGQTKEVEDISASKASPANLPDGTIIKERGWIPVSGDGLRGVRWGSTRYDSKTRQYYWEAQVDGQYFQKRYDPKTRQYSYEAQGDVYSTIENGKSVGLPEGTIIKTTGWAPISDQREAMTVRNLTSNGARRYDPDIGEWYYEAQLDGDYYRKRYDPKTRKDCYEKQGEGYFMVENGKKKWVDESNLVSLLSEQVSSQELAQIQDGEKLEEARLVKGSGDSLYLVANGVKKYFPSGDTTLQAYGFKSSDIQTLTDSELEQIPTDNGVPRLEYYDRDVERVNYLTKILSGVVSLIPGIGQFYSVMCALSGTDILTGDKLNGADRILSGLGAFGKVSTAKDLEKLGEISNFSKNITNVPSFASAFRNTTIALTGDDPFTSEIEDKNGVSRIVAGLNSPIGDNLPVIGKLNDKQLQYLTSGYQLGAAITGKEGILFGGDLTDDERWNLAVGGATPLSYEGAKYALNAYEAYQNLATYNKNLSDQNRLKGILDNMETDELYALKDKVENDNDLTNDSGLGNIREEIGERHTNTDLARNITSLERLKELGQLDESGQKMLEAFEAERQERIEDAKQDLHDALYPPMAGPGAGSADYQKTDEAGLRLTQLGQKIEEILLTIFPLPDSKEEVQLRQRMEVELRDEQGHPFKINRWGLAKEAGLDVADAVIGHYAKDFWSVTKAAKKALKDGDLAGAIAELPAPALVGVAKTMYEKGGKYSGYLQKALTVNFATKIGEGGVSLYEQNIAYYVNELMANRKGGFLYDLPGNNLIEADILNYKEQGKHILTEETTFSNIEPILEEIEFRFGNKK